MCLKYRPEYVVNLAAQAGVRYSLINPCHVDSNLVGFMNILKRAGIIGKHLLYASSVRVRE